MQACEQPAQVRVNFRLNTGQSSSETREIIIFSLKIIVQNHCFLLAQNELFVHDYIFLYRRRFYQF